VCLTYPTPVSSRGPYRVRYAHREWAVQPSARWVDWSGHVGIGDCPHPVLYVPDRTRHSTLRLPMSNLEGSTAAARGAPPVPSSTANVCWMTWSVQLRVLSMLLVYSPLAEACHAVDKQHERLAQTYRAAQGQRTAWHLCRLVRHTATQQVNLCGGHSVILYDMKNSLQPASGLGEARGGRPPAWSHAGLLRCESSGVGPRFAKRTTGSIRRELWVASSSEANIEVSSMWTRIRHIESAARHVWSKILIALEERICCTTIHRHRLSM